MAQLFIVIEKKEDWRAFYPSAQVMTVDEYLNLPINESTQTTHVVNLCSSYRYLSKGYYCSLLAEAKGHRVIPDVRAINDISRKSLYSLDLDDLNELIEQSKELSKTALSNEITVNFYFGRAPDPLLKDLGRRIFEIFSFPLLQVKFRKEKTWRFESLKPISLTGLDDQGENIFAESLDSFSHKIWRKNRAPKVYRYDLAILHNPEEKMAPSDSETLQKFITIGKSMGIYCDLLEKKDFSRLLEYDALFIRETTALNHHTYRFAKKAESEGLVVIDDPQSILRCTNKVYLSRLLSSRKIPTPKTMILDKDNEHTLTDAVKNIGFPMVIKIPDGSFSVGVVKAENVEDLTQKTKELFKKSVLLLAQEFLFTEFDWRIGVLNHKPLFACKYFMSKGHWQIYDHSVSDQNNWGQSQTLPIHKVPEKVVKTALKAANIIGNGLYGVDLKEKDGKVFIIEINDNPNIDHECEDAYLGDDLYAKVFDEFLRRLNLRSIGLIG